MLKMKFVSHRGRFSSDKNEKCSDNKIHAIARAFRFDKCAGVEIDVQLSRDNKVVMYHDLYIEGRFIADISSDELEIMYDIQKLEDLLKNVDVTSLMENKVLFLDLKGNDPNLIVHICKILSESKIVIENIIMFSFNRNLTASVPFSYKKGTTFEVIFRPDEFSDILVAHDAVMMHWTSLCQSNIDICKESNKIVCCYTHKNDTELEYLKRFNGIDYVVTDVIAD